jgi:hypothetical protein
VSPRLELPSLNAADNADAREQLSRVVRESEALWVAEIRNTADEE